VMKSQTLFAIQVMQSTISIGSIGTVFQSLKIVFINPVTHFSLLVLAA
jgi:hypothetical protein